MNIKTLADFHKTRRGSLTESFVAAVYTARRGSLHIPKRGSLSIIEVPAVVEQGRWLVRCPFCPGAELADPEDPRFYCLSCANEKVGHEWLKVRWPLPKEAIERALLVRPEVNQNWREGETVAQLAAENVAFGLPQEI